VPIFDLTDQSEAETYLTSDTVSGLVAILVKDPNNIRINQVLLVGKEGTQGSEIVKTHATTYPSGSTVTLTSAIAYPHSVSTPIKTLSYDQVEFSFARTDGGTKVVLITTEVMAGLEETRFFATEIVSGVAFYYARYKNSITSTYSAYSDPAPYGGYTLKSARAVIDSALGDINKKTSETLSDEYAFQQINNCQEEVLRELKRWSWMQEFGYIATDTVAGGTRVALPTDCDDQNTNKSVWNFRIGTLPNMTWVDKAKFDEMTYDIAQSAVTTRTVAGMTFVTVADSSDFDDSGSFYAKEDSIAYTSNNKKTGKLTLTTALTTEIQAGVILSQSGSLGTPQYYTIYGGYVYHTPYVSEQYAGHNYVFDYYKLPVPINRDSDTIVIPDPTIVQYYLQWKFLKRLGNGTEDSASQGAYNSYLMRREKLKQKEVLGKTFRLKPQINSLDMGSSVSNRKERLGKLWLE
jgi:hypothetical protein